jgi:glycosyltransferase involved in cell wall biosynthesis
VDTVVSITPLALERDGRTVKQAASVARLGYRSVVVEGRASRLAQDRLPFEVQSVRGVGWLDRLPALRYAYDSVIRYGLRTFLATPRAALYYLHAFNQFPAVYLRSRMHRVPYVYDAHDFYAEIEPPQDLGWAHRMFRLPWERWLEGRCIRHAAAVVTVSDGVAALQRGAFGCRSVVVRNCEDPRLQRPPGRSLRAAARVDPGDFLLALVGNAKPGQALPEMLTAMTRTPPRLHVVCVGRGYEALAPRLRELQLEARVHLVPPVRPFEVVPFIEEADASLLLYYPRSPNYRHCLPNGFFQAIAAGLPLLYPELPEIARLAQEHGLGLPIDPRSPESIAAGMLALLDRPERVSEFRRNARRAREVLTWAREEEVLAGLLRHAAMSRIGKA